jgi:hypothetical protein
MSDGIDDGGDASTELDSPAALGAAFAMFGLLGAFLLGGRKPLLGDVRPATGRGTLHATAWFSGLAAITVIGQLVLPLPRPLWFLIAFAAMLLVGRAWDLSRR